NFGLIKPLATGGVAGITFDTAYTLSNLNPRINPTYQPIMQFSFEQPLLQGFGVEINQLRAAHPGSLLNPINIVSRAAEGILITRIRFDEQRTQFEADVEFMLLNIDFAQTRGQYELFRDQRLQALGQVQEDERILRGLLGLPIEDGCRLVPSDTPTLTPYMPDWCSALNDAMALFPSLILARMDLKAHQLDLINEKNLLLPDIRFVSSYDFNGVGTSLSGPTQSNALRSLASGNFNDWTIGIRGDIPLGFRDAHAGVRASRLRLAQAYI